MAFQGGLEGTTVGIPQPNRLVPTGAGNSFSIGCKRHPDDVIRMAFQGGLGGTIVGIPQPNRLVPTGAGNSFSIR